MNFNIFMANNTAFRTDSIPKPFNVNYNVKSCVFMSHITPEQI